MKMQRPRGLGLVLGVLLLAWPAGGQEAQPAPARRSAPGAPTWFAKALAHGDGGLNVTYFWSKGSRMRAETVIAGHKIVTIVKGDTYYVFDPLAGHGIAIGRTPLAIAADAPDRRPFGHELEALLRQGGEKVRDEEVLGAPARLYRVTDVAGRREVWVSASEPQLPMRLTIYHRVTGRTQTTDFVNWLSNLEIADAFFEPDSGVAITRYAFAEYMELAGREGLVVPVPILYADLLHGSSRTPE